MGAGCSIAPEYGYLSFFSLFKICGWAMSAHFQILQSRDTLDCRDTVGKFGLGTVGTLRGWELKACSCALQEDGRQGEEKPKVHENPTTPHRGLHETSSSEGTKTRNSTMRAVGCGVLSLVCGNPKPYLGLERN